MQFISWIVVTIVPISAAVSLTADFKVYNFSRNVTLTFLGKRLVGHVIEEFSTKRQVTHCAYECLKSNRCRSFNYENNSLICQLNDGDHVEFGESLVNDEIGNVFEYHHRDAFSLHMEALGPCVHDPCANGGRCLDTVNWKMERTYFCVCNDGWMGDHCDIQLGRIDWSEWEDWGSCSVTCENGWTNRRRHCNDMGSGKILPSTDCFGRDVEYKSCTLQDCPRWNSWETWSECSTGNTCGRGVKSRQRTCSGGGSPGVDRYCLGFTNQTAPCQGINCWGMVRVKDSGMHGQGRVEIIDVNGTDIAICSDDTWVSYAENIVCKQIGFEGSSKGNNESIERNQTFDVSVLPEATLKYYLQCTGEEKTIQQCRRAVATDCKYLAAMHCKVRGGWSLWTSWGNCSVTCENGTRIRTRECNHPPPNFGGTPCSKEGIQYKPCTLQMCPVNGIWNTWSGWSACSHTCGYGSRHRSRTCHGPFHHGLDCLGTSSDMESCNAFSCPVDGTWGIWTEWGECSLSCGGGLRVRTRDCNDPLHGGNPCNGRSNETDVCNEHMCPIDGVWNTWSDWSDCSTTCENGTWYRNRTCHGPFFGGVDCSGYQDEAEECFLKWCPVDGTWGLWTEWDECSVTCGGGSRARTRDCIDPLYGGTPCDGISNETDSCNEHMCPVDGVWNSWSNWSECSKTCENGTWYRNRTCNGPFFGGLDCSGDLDEAEECFLKWCPVDGVWEPWQSWQGCDVSCGGGSKVRARECIGPFFDGKICSGTPEDTSECNTHECPVNGVWLVWSTWSECSTTCENGTMRRNRVCDGPFFGGLSCSGDEEDVKNCFLKWCPVDGVWNSWEDWGTCSVSCGGGNQSRTRECIGPFHNGSECQGPGEDEKQCNVYPCPVDGIFTEWSGWGACNVTCGGGIHWRNRSCDGPYNDGADCKGPYNTSQDCNTQECPIDGLWQTWTDWGSCTVTCGGGNKVRTRNCSGPFHGGADCEGPITDSAICGTDLCTIPGDWFEWSRWSLCTVTCGGGTRYRNRTCDMNSHGDLTTDCEGSNEENAECHTFDCLPLAVHCAEWASRGLNQSCTADVDPDGDEAPMTPGQVECDFEFEPGNAVTVLHHNHENRTRVKGYEGAGEYQAFLDYDIGWAEAVKIVDASAECAQFMRWECIAANIHNVYSPGMPTTYWKNRTEQITNYFGGATPDSGNCECGETSSCVTKSLPCNCDENDEIWRLDEGYVTNKQELPIHSFYAGDTGGGVEDGYHVLGPLLCW